MAESQGRGSVFFKIWLGLFRFVDFESLPAIQERSRLSDHLDQIVGSGPNFISSAHQLLNH
jgi:hypothetical protein